jgi:hypothetical protein
MVCLVVLSVIMVYTVKSTALQILCIALSSGLFVLILSGVMHARIADIFVAAPTYVSGTFIMLS